ncbi:dTMP kinase [bacterium]|nr:MAG: dTMP kinase [bacterium]
MFVTFEGPEGAGKSTALRAVAEKLREAGHRVLETREPGSGDVGKAVRALLLHGGDLEPRAELLLFLADRAQHVSEVVRPALERGEIVLCDRHADSTLVYQGVARGLDVDFVRAGNAFATGGLVPDLTLLLDVPAETGLARLENPDRMDSLPVAFHEKVRVGFLDLASKEPQRIRLLDGSLTRLQVAEEATRMILERQALSGA